MTNMVKERLENKVIVVTGASSGLGEKIGLKAAENKAMPILLARSENKLKNVSEMIFNHTEVKVSYYSVDVCHHDDVQYTFQRIIDEFGHVDILVNNAGFGIFEEFEHAEFADIQAMFAVNVLGLISCTKAVLPSMIERKRGHIINIGSQAGKLATAKSSGYSATKHAVLGFTNSLRMELKDQSIDVSLVNPGPIRTRFFDIADRSGTYAKNVEKYMLEPDYVAEQVLKLMINRKRELNLPRWMNIGSILYQLFPRLIEKIGEKGFNMK